MVHIIGEVDSYPTLDPAKPFLIVDERAMTALRYAATGSIQPPTEWWIASSGTGLGREPRSSPVRIPTRRS